MGWRGWRRRVHREKKKLPLGKGQLFVIRKYVEDVKQGQKIAPDLVESIMKASGIVKEELRRISSKIQKSCSKFQEFRVPTFGCLENSRISGGGCLQEQSRSLWTFLIRKHHITASQLQKNSGFGAGRRPPPVRVEPVIKSAASAASPEGFSSRDPVGR